MRSLRPERDDPDKDVTTREEGTAAHELASLELLGKLPRWGDLASNGVPFSGEMFEVIRPYVDFIRSEAGYAELHIEERVVAASIHPSLFGTCDAWFVADRCLHIVDLKYGFGYVDAEENWQLLCYAFAVFGGLPGGTVDRFKLTIVQPRAYSASGPVRSWDLSLAESHGYYVQLHASAAEALQPDAPTRTGTHCRYCSARAACPAFIRQGMSLIEMAGESTPDDLPNEALGLQLDIIQRARAHLEYMESGFSEVLKSKIRAGEVVPGYELKPSYGRLDWSKPLSEILLLGQLFGVDVSKPAAVTPLQAIKAGVPEIAVNPYCSKPAKGLKLTRQTKKSIAKAFKCLN